MGNIKKNITGFVKTSILVNKAIDRDLRKFEKKYNIKENQLIKLKRLIVLAAAGLMIGTPVVKAETNDYVIGNARDVVADEYDGMPLTLENGDIEVIPEGNVIFYGEKVKLGGVDVQAINSEGKVVKGTTKKDYIEVNDKIKKEKFKEQNTLYKVNVSDFSEDSMEYASIKVPIRDNTKIDANTVKDIYNGSILFGIPIYDSNEWAEVTYFCDGKAYSGYIPEQYLSKIGNIELENEQENEEIQEEIKMIVDTSSEGNVNLNLRSSKSLGDNILTEIPNGTIVTLRTGELESSSTRDWYEINYSEGAGIYQGYVAAAYLVEYGATTMEVSPKFGSEVDLKNDDTSSAKTIAKLKKGTNVIVMPGSKKGNWVKVRLEDGQTGYVRESLLIEKEKDEKNKEKVENPKIDVDLSTKEIVGIDSLGLTGTELTTLLNLENPFGEVNERYNGKKIGYAYIKIGGSAYRNPSLTTTGTPDTTIEQVKACEEAGIPYGFYYYSTSRNNIEAKQECEYLEEDLKEIKKVIDTKYNVLPVAIDVEVGHNKETNEVTDRQYYKNMEGYAQESAIKQVTNAKAYLANKFQADTGIKPIIYTGNEATNDIENKIFDLEQYSQEVGYVPNVWFAAPINEKGNRSNTTQNGINNALKNSKICMTQSSLDKKISSIDKIVDINLTSPQDLINLIKSTGNNENTNEIIEELTSENMERD